MDFLMTIVRSILNIGAVTLLPIMITLIGLYFRLSFFKALKNGLLIGIGFAGLNLVFGLLITTITPVTSFYQAAGEGFTVLDAGWQTMAAAAWASPFAAIVVPAGLIINVLLIRLKKTKTLNVDIWNYWHILLTTGIVYYILTQCGVTGITAIIIGFIVSQLICILNLKLADKMAPRWQEYFGLEGTTSTTFCSTSSTWFIAWLSNKILSLIPGINKINLSLDWVRQKLGALGDTAILSFFVGILLGVITGNSITTILQIGVGVSAVVVLMPRMVALLMEGLTPIGRAARESIQKKLGEDQEIYVGMDHALGLGDPTVITAGLLMIPITIGLAFIVPGNQYFPIGTLGGLAYSGIFHAMETNGNLFRTIIGCTLTGIFGIVVMNFMCGISTSIVASSGVLTLEAGQQVVGGGLATIPNLILALIARIFGVS